MTLSEHLENWANGGVPEDYVAGICWNLSYLVTHKNTYEWVQTNAQGWEKHSGILDYPIPSTNKKYCPETYYKQHENLWAGKQGQLRRELCAFLAQKAKEQGL